MRLLCVLLAALFLFSLCYSKRVSCRRMSWRHRCRRINRCKKSLPNLEEKCGMRYGEKVQVLRQVQPEFEYDLDFDVVLEDYVNDLGYREMLKLFSAKIVSGPVNTTAAVGGSAMFTCTVTGNPAPLTTISPVIASVESSNLISEMVQSNGIISRVNVTNIISQITGGDEGWYRCSTSNKYGSETRDAYLRVVDPCRWVECEGRDKRCVVDYTTLTAGCKCRDYCQEEGDFLPSPVCGSDCRTHFNYCSLQQTSCVDQVKIEVLYQGRCEAGIGDIELEIAGPLLYYSGDVIELECDVTGSPVTQISWYKVYQFKSTGNPGNRGNSGDHGDSGDNKLFVGTGTTLKMKRALVDDSGMYQCSVTNCSNNVVSSQPVEVVVERYQTVPTARTATIPGPVCSVFSGSRVITFDLTSYTLNSGCDYILAMDCTMASWLIYGRTTPCGAGFCLESVTIYSGWDVVSLMRGWVVTKGRSGRKAVLSENKEVVVGKFVISFDGLQVTATLADQVTLTWDGVSAAYIQLIDKRARTCGLCGDKEGSHDDKLGMRNRQQWNGDKTDFDSFAKSWRLDSLGLCQDSPPLILEDDPDKNPATNLCEDVFNSSVLENCRRHFPTGSYVEECEKETRLGSHVLGDTITVQCYLGVKYLEMCSLVLNVQVPPTLYQLGCPSTRFLQQFAVSIGCPQKVVPFEN